MLELGTPAPDFALENIDGKTVHLGDFKGRKALLVLFICNHCPFVKHVWQELIKLGKECAAKNVGVVAIMSNDIANYPDDGPDKMKIAGKEFSFPYLLDATQSVAKAYRAACTPDFYVFDANHKLAYRGQLDDSRPKTEIPVTGADLRAAIDAVASGKPAPAPQKPSIGCNIKWKPGNEPDYFRS